MPHIEDAPEFYHPEIGDTVLYTIAFGRTQGIVRPAIVTSVNGDVLNLTVFLEPTDIAFATDMQLEQKVKRGEPGEAGTWHPKPAK